MREDTPRRETRALTPRFASFPDIRQEMDRLWEAMTGAPFGRFLPLRAIAPVAVPAVDAFMKDGSYHIHVEVPGLAAEEVEISASAGELTIRGEKRQQSDVKEEDYYRSERTYGSFARQIPLPQGADVEKATATFKNGVLEIAVPVTEEAPKHRIEVKATEK